VPWFFKLLVWCGVEGYVSGLQDVGLPGYVPGLQDAGKPASCKPDT